NADRLDADVRGRVVGYREHQPGMVPEGQLEIRREPVHDAAAFEANLLRRATLVVRMEPSLVEGAGESNGDLDLDRAGGCKVVITVDLEAFAGREVANRDADSGAFGTLVIDMPDPLPAMRCGRCG